MVIITTIVAKIYFPESLERGSSGMPQARTFNYRMADGDYYGSDDENDGEIQEEAKDGSFMKMDNDIDDDNEILDSDGELSPSGNDEYKDEDNDVEGRQPVGNEQEGETDDLLTEMRPQKTSGKRSGVSFSNKDLLEFEQVTLSKTEVLKRLTLCTVMLTVTFVAWGVLQVFSNLVCKIFNWSFLFFAMLSRIRTPQTHGVLLSTFRNAC